MDTHISLARSGSSGLSDYIADVIARAKAVDDAAETEREAEYRRYTDAMIKARAYIWNLELK